MFPKVLIALSLMCSPLVAQDALLRALAEGKVNLEVRTRYEHGEDDDFRAPADHKTANALTNRTFLGLKTGPIGGVQAYMQFANVSSFGWERYNSNVNGRTQFALVQDPTQNQFLQAYVSWKGLKVGRQMLSVDTQRFIGPGAWSQMPKTFTGVTLQENFGLKWMEVFAGHLTRMHTSIGENKELKAEFLRVRFMPLEALNLTPFVYAVEDVKAPATSRWQQGLRADGSFFGFLYDATFAQQRTFKDSTSSVVPDADYLEAIVGYKFKGLSVKVAHEALEPGFQTPMGSLHNRYGWSDRIGTNPADGLRDQYLQVEFKVGDVALEVQAHAMKAERTHQKYGTEYDFSASYAITKAFSAMVKYADYQGDRRAPAALAKDLNKFWLMTTFKF